MLSHGEKEDFIMYRSPLDKGKEGGRKLRPRSPSVGGRKLASNKLAGETLKRQTG